MEKHVLITAAGKGKRFGGTTPKQFIIIKDKPVIIHTVNSCLNYKADIDITIVIDKEFDTALKENLAKFFPGKEFNIVMGGKTRTESVKNGLKTIPVNMLVAIQDAVRPIVSKDIIEKGFELAEKKGSAVPFIDITESVRKVDKTGNRTVNRDKLKLIQTPQFFKAGIIMDAYKNVNKTFTDDATVLEQAGHKIFLFKGDRKNIKITYQEDIKVVEAFL